MNETNTFFTLFNASLLNGTTNESNQLLNFGFILRTTHVSTFLNIKPDNLNIGYFLCMSLGYYPFVNENKESYDSCKIYCSTGKFLKWFKKN
jgi:hypothetical protein